MDTNGYARSRGDIGSERQDAEPHTVAGAKLEIAATRTRMQATVAELEQQMSDRIDNVKQKVDVVGLIERHPWPALAVAFVAGIALSATGSDRRAARAAAQAAIRAPNLAKRGAVSAASGTAAGVSKLASATVGRIKGKPDDRSISGGSAQSSGGIASKATSALAAQVRELHDDATRGVDELASSMLPPKPQT